MTSTIALPTATTSKSAIYRPFSCLALNRLLKRKRQGRGKEQMRAGGFMIVASLLAASCAATGADTAPRTAAKAPRNPVFVESDLLGKSSAALDGLLGKPALVRREGPGEYRRYAFAECALIVILYADDTGMSAVRRLDAAAKASGAPKPDLGHCLAAGPERR
jgi:hypothetical protein